VAVLKPRERLVYFRISEDEFRQFVNVCEQEGARSVSDLARSAVQRLIADGHRQKEDDEMTEKMHKLEKLIAAVTEQLQMLVTTQGDSAATIGFTKNVQECLTANNNFLDANGGRGQ